jgi:hypothetical protein
MMRTDPAMGFDIKLSSGICHFSDNTQPLFGDNAPLIGDNQSLSDS